MTHRNKKPLALLAALLAAAPVAAEEEKPCPSHQGGGRTAAAPGPAPGEAAAPSARVELADVELLDQDGAKVRFVDLVAGDRIVVMDFIFTTCTTVCPVLSAIMAKIQDRLGERNGKEVVLVSVSVDPARDTPARMKAFAARFKARPGWAWLTGPKGDLEDVLKGMGAYTASFADHPPMILVGDGKAGTWQRFNGFPKVDQILARVDALVAARGAMAHKE